MRGERDLSLWAPWKRALRPVGLGTWQPSQFFNLWDLEEEEAIWDLGEAKCRRWLQ